MGKHVDCTAARSDAKEPGLVCPVNFHPRDVLRGPNRKLADGLVYLAHAIIMRRVQAPRCEIDGFSPLCSIYLRKILGARNWPRVKRAALDVGLVECNERYVPDERSKGYRLKEPYRGAKWAWRAVEDTRLAKRLENWRASDRRRVWEMLKAGRCPVPLESVEHLWDNLQRIRIDDTIDEPLTNETQLAVELIRRGEWRLDVDEYGRVHTNVTNLKKTLRRRLSVGGKRLANCDVANSQPLFLGILFSKEVQKTSREAQITKTGGREGEGQGQGQGRTLCCALFGNPGNLREYLAVCERGEFYRRVGAHLDTDLDYDVLKQRVLAVLYDKPWHRNKVSQAMEACFPVVMAALREMKRDDYRRAAHLAQRTESDFIIGRCVGRLRREDPDLFITTIHDAIMTTAGAERIVRGIMREEFARLGVHPTVRVER